MIIWSIKLIFKVRRAIAGRQYPHQLAWAVALGVLLGLVPHGNLLALTILIMLLSLKINHAMAALTAITVTFTARMLDPYAHDVGAFVLTNEAMLPHLATAWQLPLVPWTDLNNTIVMGSFLIGIAAVLPIFGLTYPLFRLAAPKAQDLTDVSLADQEPLADQGQSLESESDQDMIVVDRPHQRVSNPHCSPVKPVRRDENEKRVPEAKTSGHSNGPQPERPATAVETKIDVIRMKDSPAVACGTKQEPSRPRSVSGQASIEHQPMDEALNYLLCQLRNSKQKDAA